MKKILLSVATLVAAGAIVAGATGAFYGDVERSTGNTFTAGSIELLVDSTSHYDGMICTEVDDDVYVWVEEGDGTSTYPELLGEACDGTWAETDLEGGVHKFFNFLDLKPGDYGEDTISLHVYDNDAWGQFVISSVVDIDNGCTDPEQEAEAGACENPDDGEIDDNLRFTGWIDQGLIPGFQNGGDNPQYDPAEGDNEYQIEEGPKFWDNTLIGDLGPFNLSDVFELAYLEWCTDPSFSPDGHNDYDYCHGFAEDGRMVASTTYYFGLAWDLDLDATGNEVQTDSYVADMIFQVEQHRNNPTPFGL